MASGFFALFDDIAVLMDDVAAMSKLATKKTAGILADDLAVNADKASGFVSSRELPVLWKITKGSFLNKLIIVPVVLSLNAFFPAIITPILMIGGVYLAFEGAEKIYEFFFNRKAVKQESISNELTGIELLEHEKKKIKSAILVDFILSIEIVIIALSSVVHETQAIQIAVVSVVAIIATVGVYGIVALLVRMDDFGLALISSSKDQQGFRSRLGKVLVNTLPILIRILAVVGTLAMILVAGGIFVHNIHYIHDLFASLPSLLSEFIVGLAVGIIAAAMVKLLKTIFKKK
jgi:predicted DNA repair protein MutK